MAKYTICKWEFCGKHYEGDHWKDTAIENTRSAFGLEHLSAEQAEEHVEKNKALWMDFFKRHNAFVEVEA